MKFVWLIAIILAILFGFSVAANFLAGLWLAALCFLFISAVIETVANLLKLKLLDAIGSALLAALWGWILSICF